MTTPGSADEAIFDAVSGTDQNGNGLSYAEVAFLYDAHLLGLSKDYAFPEGGNVSFSRLDAITTLAKILSRTHSHSDGNDYDVWDAIQTILKWVLQQDVHINDNEVNSVNYKKPVAGSAEVPARVRPTGAAPPVPHGDYPGPGGGHSWHPGWGPQGWGPGWNNPYPPPPWWWQPPTGQPYNPPPPPWYGPWP
jgi:hypothetical protein